MQFAFISWHEPTVEQINMAAELGHSLHSIGDCDAFQIDAGFVPRYGPYEGVVVVHPVAALRLASDFVIGVFENKNLAEIGEKPIFAAHAFHIYDLRSELS